MNRYILRKFLIRFFIYLFLIILAAVFLIPIYGVVTLSFKNLAELQGNYWGLPRQWALTEYKSALFDKYVGVIPFIKNSFIITIPSVVLIVLFSSLMAYPISRFKIRGSRILFYISIFGITIPHAVLIIPVFKILNLFGLYNEYIGLIWVHVAFSIPFATFLLRNFMVSIPKEIQEAATIDGCNIFGIYRKIIMPLTVPAIAVLSILNFTWIYNDFLFGLILTSGKNRAPVQVGITILQSTQWQNFNWGTTAASAILATLPTVLVFIFAQKFFIKGITLGAVKG